MTRTRTTTWIVLAAAMLFAGAAETRAQSGTSDSGWHFGVGPRYTFVRNPDTDESSHMGGGFARLRSQYVGLEGAVDYHQEDLPFGVDLKTWPISTSLLIYPIPVVYGLAGVAWYNTTIDYPEEAEFLVDDETDSQLGYHFGVGVEFPISNKVRLTSDVRWLFVDYEFEEIPESVGEVDNDLFTWNAGLVIYFGEDSVD